ncbi:MAG TPA: dihydrolipoamide acetyltransferase family protein [Streptosporangiaceae bacterium]
MSELKQFKLPDVGEGLTEADIVKWHVQPGDAVAINQVLVEIETAKSVVELPSPYAGVVADLLVPEGATADVGTPIIAVDISPGSTAPAGASEPGMVGSPAPKIEPLAAAPADTTAGGPDSGAPDGGSAKGEERQAVLVGYGVKLGTTKRRARKTTPIRTAANGSASVVAPERPAGSPAPTARPTATATATAAPPMAAPVTGAPAGPAAAVLAKPPVRKMARDLGVDLATLTGTGPQGSITRDDVQQAATGLATAGPVPGLVLGTGTADGSAAAREERIPIRGVRKHTAAAMSASAFTAPHVTEFLQIDMTETMAATARMRAIPEFAEIRVTPLLLVARALMVAVARHPMINSSWDEDAQEIVVRHYVNLGIAATTDRGLIVPNIRDAHALSLPGLARALAELTERARSGKATPSDLRGGTITITNVGVFGVDTGTPILTPGEAAILAFGRVRDAPWVHEGQLAVRKVTTLALSFDHRIVDGDLGSAVLRDIGAMLEDPLRMLAWS